MVRLTIASILAVVIPLLAADLATAGVVPVTTIPTALLLSAALVAVVLILALLPSLESKVEWVSGASSEPRIPRRRMDSGSKVKDN